MDEIVNELSGIKHALNMLVIIETAKTGHHKIGENFNYYSLAEAISDIEEMLKDGYPKTDIYGNKVKKLLDKRIKDE